MATKKICVESEWCTGHGCWPSRQNETWSLFAHVDGLGIHRVTDIWKEHCCTDCHKGVAIEGSGFVFCEGLAVTRVGDAIDCGSKIKTGRDWVFVAD